MAVHHFIAGVSQKIFRSIWSSFTSHISNQISFENFFKFYNLISTRLNYARLINNNIEILEIVLSLILKIILFLLMVILELAIRIFKGIYYFFYYILHLVPIIYKGIANYLVCLSSFFKRLKSLADDNYEDISINHQHVKYQIYHKCENLNKQEGHKRSNFIKSIVKFI